MDNIFDYHMHSHHSPDGHDSVDALCKSALEAGLSGIAVTDHCEINVFEAHGYAERIKGTVQEVSAARDRYRGRLPVAVGIELGQWMHNPKLAAQVIADNPFDFVLCSLHNCLNMDDYFDIDYSHYSDMQALVRPYFSELLSCVKTADFDILGHLTYPKRYIVGVHKRPLDLSEFDDVVDEIFKALIARGKGIEINTSGLRGELCETMPSRPYVKRFRELGGELLTIGSDSHCAADVGKGIRDGVALAKEAGFTHIATYENRKPVLHAI